ncbi:MAG: hypothetical protein HYX69_00500 [Planctomycetia bacterium]|nr:hypothetical protein [Planctomycetia bacterium]
MEDIAKILQARGTTVPRRPSNRRLPSDLDSAEEQHELLAQLALFLEAEHVNPCRKPWWRWELAGALSSALSLDDIGSLDPALARAARLRRSLQAAPADALPADLTDMAVAYQITQMELRKWHLQARLLARETTEEIADRTGFSEATVDFYEEVFFNVRPHLSARGWIRATVLEAIMDQSERAFQLAELGYLGGPCVLESVIDGFADYPVEERDALRLKADLCTKLLIAPLDRELLKLVNVYLDLRQLEMMKARQDVSDLQAQAAAVAKEVAETLESLRNRPTVSRSNVMPAVLPAFDAAALARLGVRQAG